jgi:hypothetical protein
VDAERDRDLQHERETDEPNDDSLLDKLKDKLDPAEPDDDDPKNAVTGQPRNK